MIYEKISLIKPYSYIYNNFGYLFFLNQNYSKANILFKKAIKTDKENGIQSSEIYFYNLGCSLEKLKLEEEAMLAYSHALKICPNYENAFYNLGCLYYRSNKFILASDMFKKSIELCSDLFSYLNLGNCYAKLKNYKEACECFKKVINLNAKVSDAYHSLALNLEHLEMNEEALNYLEKLIKIDPNNEVVKVDYSRIKNKLSFNSNFFNCRIF